MRSPVVIISGTGNVAVDWRGSLQGCRDPEGRKGEVHLIFHAPGAVFVSIPGTGSRNPEHHKVWSAMKTTTTATSHVRNPRMRIDTAAPRWQRAFVSCSSRSAWLKTAGSVRFRWAGDPPRLRRVDRLGRNHDGVSPRRTSANRYPSTSRRRW